MGEGQLVKALFVALSILGLVLPSAYSRGSKRTWQDVLLANIKTIEASQPEGEIGIFIKNLRTGSELSYKGEEFWYIASGIKLPVALAVLKSIDEKTLTLETKVGVLEADYIDGAGELNYIKPNSQVSIRLLLDQSLTFSDNTATDMLIRQVGLEKINALTSSLVPKGFNAITTLAEVRRQVFSQFHPEARRLSNMDYIRLRVLKDESEKLALLSKLLQTEQNKLKLQSLDAAYAAYYAEGLNSASLRGYGQILEKLIRGQVLKENSQKYLVDLLERVETGKGRIKAGIPKSYVFAHKTGSQYRRYCDMGILTNGEPKSDQVVLVACTRKLTSENAENQLQRLGGAVHESGVFGKRPKTAK